MNKTKFLSVLMIPAMLVVTGCGEKELPKFPVAQLQALQQGVKVEGIITSTTDYFKDKECIEPSALSKTTHTKTRIVLTYTDKKDYQGVDVKLYEVGEDNKEKYLFSENAYNNAGHLFFNSVDYDNVLVDSLSAQDIHSNPMPYGTNASLNPFRFVDLDDFKHIDKDMNNYSLDKIKSSLMFGFLTYYNMDVPVNINIKDNKFTFSENGLNTIHFETAQYKEITTIGLTNVYTLTDFVLDLNVLEQGETNSKNEITPEPVKPENDELGLALKNFARATSFRVNRHYKTTASPTEETIDVYFSGPQKAIYMSAYYRDLGPRPMYPTEADVVLVDSNDEDTYLNAYAYQPLADDNSKFAFQRTGSYPSINNNREFYEYLLPLNGISKDVFDKNEDGSYSPIVQNIPYMAGECFVPFLCTTSEISNGYVEDCRIYLTEDKKMIDHLVIETKISDIEAVTTVTYDQINSCVIPFNALMNIIY